MEKLHFTEFRRLQLKITYEFDNGDVVTVQVSEEIGRWILASRRREASDDKYHHRYCYSLDAINDKTDWVATRQYNPEDMIDRMIEEIEQELSREEKRRLDKGMISRRYKAAIKKIKKYF